MEEEVMEEVKKCRPETIRVNIRVSEKVKKYFEEKSNSTAVSQSALMALALDEYIDQKIMLEFAKNVNNISMRENRQ